MRLFKLDVEGNLVYNDNVWAIEAFYELWDRDTSKNHESAIKDLAFCYFITSTSMDNQYREYGKVERVKMVSLHVYGEIVNVSKDKAITKAINVMLDLDRSAIKDNLRSIVNNLEKLRMHLDSINLDERDEKGKPIHSMKQYGETLLLQSKTYKEMKEALKNVDNESFQGESNIRGNEKRELDI